jgi:hypothetical protein
MKAASFGKLGFLGDADALWVGSIPQERGLKAWPKHLDPTPRSNGISLRKSSSGILPLSVLDKRLEARFYHRLSRLT